MGDGATAAAMRIMRAGIMGRVRAVDLIGEVAVAATAGIAVTTTAEEEEVDSILERAIQGTTTAAVIQIIRAAVQGSRGEEEVLADGERAPSRRADALPRFVRPTTAVGRSLMGFCSI